MFFLLIFLCFFNSGVMAAGDEIDLIQTTDEHLLSILKGSSPKGYQSLGGHSRGSSADGEKVVIKIVPTRQKDWNCCRRYCQNDAGCCALGTCCCCIMTGIAGLLIWGSVGPS